MDAHAVTDAAEVPKPKHGGGGQNRWAGPRPAPAVSAAPLACLAASA
jgi:hypothetical protein